MSGQQKWKVLDMKKIFLLGLTGLVIISSSALAGDALRIRSAFDYLRYHNYLEFPNTRPTLQPSKKGPDYQVGDTREFWSWDLSQMPPQDVLVPSTCRAVGDHVYLFVADDQWGSSVAEQDLPSIMDALETHTPSGSINPDQGVVPNDISVFGDIPDALDGDPHIFVLLMEIKKYGGNQFDGFFNAYDQYPDEETMAQYGYHSNEVEMITVNSAIRSVSSEITMSIFAHELQHLIHWGLDVDEVAWVNESMSELAMSINGLYTDVDWVNDYLADPSASLFEQQHVHYGACQLFGQYLYERFGSKFISRLVADTGNGVEGFSEPLSSLDNPVSMDDLLLDWASANIGDGMGLNQEILSYALFDLAPMNTDEQISEYPTDPAISGSIPPTGAAYLEFSSPENGEHLLLDIAGDPNDRLLARLIMAPAQGVDGPAWTAEPDQDGHISIPFSAQDWASKAYLVLFALDGGNVTYTVTAQVEQQADDGGVDAGVDADAGIETDQDHSDGGSNTDSSASDAGADADEKPQSDDGCGCDSAGAASASGFGFFALLILVAIKRRKSLV